MTNLQFSLQARELPPVEWLRDRYSYNPQTGVISHGKSVFVKARRGVRADMRARGRRVVKFVYDGEKRTAAASRVAWCLYYGKRPPLDRVVDHINRDPSDNRIVNLRLVSFGTNIRNSARCVHKQHFPPADGLDGFTVLPSGAYQVSIRRQSRPFYLGLYKTEAEAAAAYQAAARVLKRLEESLT